MSATALSRADYEAAFAGDRIRKILDVVELLKGLDVSKITNLVGLIKQIAEAQTLADAVKYSLEALAVIASMTPTESDDKLVAIVRSIMSDELLALLSKIVGGFLGQDARAKFNMAQDAGTYSIDHATRTTLHAQGIPIDFLFQLALLLLPLLERFVTGK